MVTHVNINTYDDLVKYIESIEPNGPPVVLYFSGTKDADGNSWCPFCVTADPVVKSYFTELQKNVVILYVDVGVREYWKDPACPFRTDNRINVSVIPTLIKWNGAQRLERAQCNTLELLQKLFEDEN